MRFILLSSFFWTTVLTAQFKDKSYPERLSFFADQNDYYAQKVFEISKFCQEFLNKSLGRLPNNAKNIDIRLEGEPPLNKRAVYFKRSELQSMNSYQILHRILGTLLQRHLNALSQKNIPPIPDWILAAYLHNIQLNGNDIMTMEKYPVTRYSITHNRYPDVDKLLDGKSPAPENYWLYRMYCEQCAVLLYGIERLLKGKATLLRHIMHNSTKTSLFDLLSEKDDAFLSPRGRRIWYVGVSQKLCFNIINPYPPAIIAKKVDRLFSVTIARPGASGTMRVPLEELSDKEDRVLDNFYINFLESDFFEIYMTSSAVIRPVLYEFTAALEKLKDNDKKGFKEDINKARKKFKQTLKKQQELNDYLDKLEEKYRPPNANFRLIIKAQQLADNKRKTIFPNWYNYLDKLEKKLESIDF